MKSSEKSMEKIVNLCKARGFIFAGSEIYGGLANTWDYGPLGVELKNNVKKAWWKKFVQENPYNVGLDAAILMNPQVWVASGHVGGFSDPLMDCKECHERFRADKVIEDWCQENGFQLGRSVDAMSQQEMKSFIDEHQIACPTCGRTQIDLISMVHQVEELLKDVDKSITVAVMGCIVNGPGEARHADVGIAGGKGEGVLFKCGEIVARVPEEELVPGLMKLIGEL